MHKITHILSIHDNPKHLFPEKHYLCVMAADNPDQVSHLFVQITFTEVNPFSFVSQDLSQYFSVCNDFIHGARLRQDCNVLIHCLAGMSRSVRTVLSQFSLTSKFYFFYFLIFECHAVHVGDNMVSIK